MRIHSTSCRLGLLFALLVVACSSSQLSTKSQRAKLQLSKTRRDSSNRLKRGGAKAKISQPSTKSSISASVFNLVNNVAGAGILTLSAGMAGGTGWIPAILVCVSLGWISCHTFSVIGEACELTGEKDFKGLWAKTLGENSTYVVELVITIMCLAASVIYSGILGDVFTPLLKGLGLSDQYNYRTTNILIITATLLLPLSLLKNLSSLAFTSILGFAAIMYTVVFVVIRSLDGSYSLDGPGKFVTATLKDAAGGMLLMPSFEKQSLWNVDSTSLVLASNLGLAYVAHYNGPAFYRELDNANSSRFTKMVAIGFTILTLLYIIIMLAGYSTFGDVCQGNLLLNYHPQDLLSTLARAATGFSILFGFPLIISGAREGIQGALTSKGISVNHFWLVLGILSFVTAVSVSVEDVSTTVGLTGAAMGSFIVYICPVLIYTRAVAITKGKQSDDYSRAKWNLALVPFGLCIGALGVYVTIRESMSS